MKQSSSDTDFLFFQSPWITVWYRIKFRISVKKLFSVVIHSEILLNPWMRLCKKLVVARLVKKFPISVELARQVYVHNSTVLDTNQGAWSRLCSKI
jgi:hypothetical protein